ncbi:MAG: phosphate-starvation-inducible PsiE family protein [Richelia sp. RM2_1_2]|nr:phosphate-starvation-inducible PsiE family protein [Richelia sp. SM1_7_0]NJO57402.1 phosphate-starvation-inducible PsiE family protein [Richelia sp. RM2_1_2]NJS16842.1 phosphate-starvation-inducible PsiE family protein [Nostocaceae cyanobacterium CSU_2_110]
MRNFLRKIRKYNSNENCLYLIEKIEELIAKLLSITMVVIIFFAIIDLSIYVVNKILIWDINKPDFNDNLFTTFGLFLNVLIALEILENITAYLRKNVIHVELVIGTSLIAVARKIIILDLDKTDGIQVIGLAIAVFALSISYWIIRSKLHKN